LLSVVIPTRNRQEYAVTAVLTALRIRGENLEVVVHDNSDACTLRDALRNATGDRRLRYRYCATPLSFVGAFEAALEMSEGRYVCMIGDDDGVTGELLEAAQWADDRRLDALTPAPCAFYLWPQSGLASTMFTRISQTSGLLQLAGFSSKVIAVNPRLELEAVVRNGAQNYLDTKIPRLYHGLVSRTCLKRVRARAGSVFGGLSPDIFAALAIAQVADGAVYLDYPLTLPGACKASGSIQGLAGGHRGRLEEAPHLKYRGEYRWAALVPRYYSVPSIWADSAIAALEQMGRQDLVAKIDVARLTAACLRATPAYWNPILRHFIEVHRLLKRSTAVATARLVGVVMAGSVGAFGRRARGRVLGLLGGAGVIHFDGLATIAEAVEALESFLRASGRSFHGCVGRPDGTAPEKPRFWSRSGGR
jgi:glycosyltransferase involved in cell wall biosynthesis